ncbi:hypothetical protein PPYR_05212 [Photinus pyralis]|uniref:Uncharacterized protein n=1 Tax=Photinus pyralis TaxID=7054 RepID=A0A1Y1MBU0_PHOPY|nr:uncharacterized protein LOC116164251 [Photinus pyralis]KAB0803026.1 hypothetical protein PPYR_05212 [Photinus pyralis]
MKSLCFIGAIFFIAVYQQVEAIPFTRLKRVSDQRLAELETLVALSKMSGKLVTVPLGLGKVDPKLIGRKRRSQSRLLDSLFNHSAEEDAGALEYEENYRYRK